MFWTDGQTDVQTNVSAPYGPVVVCAARFMHGLLCIGRATVLIFWFQNIYPFIKVTGFFCLSVYVAKDPVTHLTDMVLLYSFN